MTKTLRLLSYIVLLGTFFLSLSSCDKDDDPIGTSFGTITGTVTDQAGQPIANVTVTVSGVNEEDLSATTSADGKYTIDNVSMKIHAVTFSKAGWLTISKSVDANDFNEKVATANATLVNASAKIRGTLADGANGGAPLAGVTISVGVAGTVTSGNDGTYTI